MTKIIWDKVGERLYETGISRGVLYQANSIGVPWNGLTAIEENTTNDAEPVHFDGFKYNDIVTLGDFTAVLRAFTYPDEFLDYEGTMEDQTGFYVTNQPQTHFGLSYRTETSNDTAYLAGYKIHLLYNLLAIPTQKVHQTMSLDTAPQEFEWNLSAIPEPIENFRPTAHVIIDSRKIDPYLLADLEDILYGTDERPPKLPDLSGFATYIRKWERLVITDLGDGKWEAYSPLPDIITMIDDTTFQIVSDQAVYLDEDSYTITSSEKNEEDLWPPSPG